MQVAIYMDGHDQTSMALMGQCIRSVKKHMPHARVLHLTSTQGPVLQEVDAEIRVDVEGEFGYRRSYLHSKVEGDVLFLDNDVIVREDVSGVFDDAFDIAVTTDMKPGSPEIRYNGGVTFSRNQGYWREQADLFKALSWWELEPAYTKSIETCGLNVKVLPGEQYNRVPETPDDVAGKIIHFRGRRKLWMLGLFEIGKDTSFTPVLNTSADTMMAQARENLKRDVGTFQSAPAHDGVALLVGGGPSLADTLEPLTEAKKFGGTVFALNGAHDFLIERGIVPDYHVMLDARAENARFVEKPHKDVTYLIAAQCHPSVFDALEGFNVVRWIGAFPEAKELVKEGHIVVGGGSTVGLKAMVLATLMGFRAMHLHGYDSSYRYGRNHAYEQPLNDAEATMDVTVAGRKFHCARWMARQAMLFQENLHQLTKRGVEVDVYGDGLIPWIVRQMSQETRDAA